MLVASLATPTLHAQNDWPGYAHDAGGQRYSPLKQINTTNVTKLVPAWSYQMMKNQTRLSQSIPIMVNGVLYVGYPQNRVAALEPETGKVLWEFAGKMIDRDRITLGSMRSLTYWPGDKQTPPQIVFGTPDGELYSLNAKTGRPNPGFGNEGVVNLRTPEIMNGFPNIHYGLNSGPFVYKNLVFTGAHNVATRDPRDPRAMYVHGTCVRES
jgi:quinoprotein glucose dehydrogenase